MLEQIEGEGAERNEEDEDPDRPVIEPIVELVAISDLPSRCVFDRNDRHGGDAG